MSKHDDATVKSGGSQKVCEDFRYRPWNGTWCQAAMESRPCKRQGRCVSSRVDDRRKR